MRESKSLVLPLHHGVIANNEFPNDEFPNLSGVGLRLSVIRHSWFDICHSGLSLARSLTIGNGERELLQFCGQVDADEADAFW